MANTSGKFRAWVMSFSFGERKKKELLKYKQRVRELESMDLDELDFEYITLKSTYEHKKGILTLLIISIALAILMNVWKYFFIFVEKALHYASSFMGGEVEIVKVSFIISVIVAVFVTFLILFVLLEYMRKICQIQKELMIIELVRNKRSE